VMLNDIDFFSLHDLFDTRELHHEHVVVVLFFCGIVAAALPLIAGKLQRMEN